MEKPPASRTGERVTAGLLAVFFEAMGWFTLLQGGISLKGKSGHSSFVDGGMGLVMALFFFLVSAFGVALLLRSLDARRSTYTLAAVLLLLPPLVFVAVRAV